MRHVKYFSKRRNVFVRVLQSFMRSHEVALSHNVHIGRVFVSHDFPKCMLSFLREGQFLKSLRSRLLGHTGHITSATIKAMCSLGAQLF